MSKASHGINVSNANIKSSFVKNSAITLVGHIFATAITLLTLPVITRLFTPDAFGVLAIYTSIVMALSPMVGASYENGLLLPRTTIGASNLLALNVIIVLIFFLFSGIFVFVTGDLIASVFNFNSVNYVYLIPVGLLLTGLARVFSFWAIRSNKFMIQAKGRVAQAVLDRVVGVISGINIALPGSGWLIIAQITGQICLVIVLWPKKQISKSKQLKFKVCLSRMYAMAIRYKKFPVYSMGANLMQAITRELPVIILAIFFSPMVVGFYALSCKVIGQPFMMLGDSISRAYFHKAAELKRNGEELVMLTERLLYYLLAGTLFPMLILILLINDLFPVIFGAEWQDSGSYAQLVGLFFFVAFIYRPLSIYFDLMEIQEKRLIYNSVLLAINVVVLLVGGIMGDPLFAVTLFVFTNFILYSIAIFWLCRYVGVTIKSLFNILIRVSQLVVPLYLLVIFLLYKFEASVAIMTIIGAVSCFIYYVLLIYRDQYLLGLFKKGINRFAMT